MRKLLNTLYITTPNAYLSKDGNSIVVSVEQKEVFRIPAINIEGIVTFGYCGASPGLMHLCSANGISLTFLSPSGKYIGRFQGPEKGNVLLRNAQHKRFCDPAYALHLAKVCIGGKIKNSRTILKRFIRDNGHDEAIEKAQINLKFFLKNVIECETCESVTGFEGMAANRYFDVFGRMIVSQKDKFNFSGRSRRPPKDPVNVLLSFAYTLLAHDVAAALDTVGFDPYVGFLHKLRPGRTSLALDMMEELRAYICDRLVLSMINLKQISSSDFIWQSEDTPILTDSGRKTLITAWQQRKKDEITHPYIGEKIPIGLLPYVQAMLLARYVRGELDDYPVFIVK